mmetsp:Transcript_77155/g.200718  ORF Transcript_77155/g.200718 Transcript_77155/m.200718 type:complete len:230 (+) Transcript_77155:236-925(+)
MFKISATLSRTKSGPAPRNAASPCVPVRTAAVQTPALRPSSMSTTVSPTFKTWPTLSISAMLMALKIASGLGRRAATTPSTSQSSRAMTFRITASSKPLLMMTRAPRARNAWKTAEVPGTSRRWPCCRPSESASEKWLLTMAASSSTSAFRSLPMRSRHNLRIASRFSTPRRGVNSAVLTSMPTRAKARCIAAIAMGWPSTMSSRVVPARSKTTRRRSAGRGIVLLSSS